MYASIHIKIKHIGNTFGSGTPWTRHSRYMVEFSIARGFKFNPSLDIVGGTVNIHIENSFKKMNIRHLNPLGEVVA